ncbi:LysE family translocator [Ralstonia syzygii]|uniref:Putative amino-acid efflux transmembrane protein n=1 Tax=Ralstonia syzygii R24 TaxID=907261 RepID=G3AA45_9RALS|nr:LysE family translocator [Ralstonia syzygii]CCA88179.1 putative amino-acid efflux transmembrane protein [Ralstonia syzygii R24]
MQLSYSILGLYIVTILVFIAVPGPVVLQVTGAGLSGGPYRALRTAFGTNAGSLLLILMSALAIKGLMSIDASMLVAIRVLGCLYIGYVGFQLVRQPAPRHAVAGGPKLRSGGFSKGFLTCISNPQDIVFFASVFPQFIRVTTSPNHSLFLLTLVWIVLEFLMLMLIYLFISRVTRPSTHQGLMKIAGVVQLVLAGVGGVSSIVELAA